MIFYGVFLAGAAKMMIKQRINGIPVTETSSTEGQEEEIGKPVNEIVSITEENGYDLIVMASSRISSSVRLLGSTTKGVIDSIRKPVLIIHK
jgi:nucleotide-binding universal stress UspA family protein